MKSFSKLFNQNNEQKVGKLKLSKSKKSSSISSSKGNSSSNTVSAGGKGVQVNNKTIVVKSNTTTTGFNYKTGSTMSKSDVGGTASASLNYIDRDSANQHETELDDRLSNTYTLDKQLTNDEVSDTKKELREEGAEGLRRDIISLNHDDKLDKDDHIEIARNSIQKFHEETGKKADVYMSFHSNTEHNHVHINSVGSKEDVKITKEQLQMLKVITAKETALKLDEKELKHSLHKHIEREEKTLERHSGLQKAFDSQNKDLKNLEADRNSKMEQAFSKYSNNNSFSQEEVKQLQQIQKTSGYVQHLEKSQEKNPSEETAAKLEKAKSWESSLKDKVSIETQDKFEHLQKQIKEFPETKEAQDINKEHLLKQQEVLNKTANKADDLNFKKSADSLRDKSDNLSSKKLNSFSTDKALELKEKEERMNKHLTHEQQIDKLLDGKLDNKQNVFQH